MGALFAALGPLLGGGAGTAAGASQIPIWQQVMGTMASMSKKPGMQRLGGAMISPRTTPYIGMGSGESPTQGTGEGTSGTPQVMYRPNTFLERMSGTSSQIPELNTQLNDMLYRNEIAPINRYQKMSDIEQAGLKPKILAQREANASTLQGLDPKAQAMEDARYEAELSSNRGQIPINQLKASQAAKMQEVIQNKDYVPALTYETIGRPLNEAGMFPINKRGAELNNTRLAQDINRTDATPTWVGHPGTTENWASNSSPDTFVVRRSPQEMEADRSQHYNEPNYTPASTLIFRRNKGTPASGNLGGMTGGVVAPITNNVVTPSIGAQQIRPWNDYVVPAAQGIQNAFKNYKSQLDLEEEMKRRQYKGMRNQLINIP